MKKRFQYPKHYGLYDVVYYLLIGFCVIALATGIIDFAYSGAATRSEEMVETMGGLSFSFEEPDYSLATTGDEEVVETMGGLSSPFAEADQSLATTGDGEVVETMGGPSSLFAEPDHSIKEYADIIVTVITAIIVALVSITVTIFVFLKSALDRIIDENSYIADIANIYKTNSSSLLAKLCVWGFATLLLSMVWHFFLTFIDYHSDALLCIGMVAMTFALLCNLMLSGLFWGKCIRVEGALQKIIGDECERLQKELTKQPFMAEDSGCLQLIGDWDQWETEYMSEDDLTKHGHMLCQKMTPDQFINLFLRTEILLLAGERGLNGRSLSDSDILTVLQERSNILNPNTRVGNQDLKGRYYSGGNGNGFEIIYCMEDFQKKVGYIENDSNFFSNTKDLYSILQQYRNLLISWKFTLTKGKKENRSSRKPSVAPIENKDTQTIFAQGLYYFFLRILAVFVSALHISDFSFNGFTLNFANFYSSTLENVSLYSSEFYHTIFARTQLIRAVMDVSRFDSVDFYNTKFSDSTLNNAEFNRVCFEGVQMNHGGLSACVFIECQLHNSNFMDCVLNNSEFIDCQLSSVDFLRTKMRGITWTRGVVLNRCNFQHADIQGWTWQGGYARMRDCDFSYSTWNETPVKWGELTGSDFSNAVLTEISFESTRLESALFQQCGLALAQFNYCDMNQASLERALLFEACFRSTKLNMANLFEVAAVKAQFIECDLTDSNCADADFSEGIFTKTELYAARLYDCSLVKAKFTGCNCNYLLADHMQFTFAQCTKSSFCYGSLSDSNLTRSTFTICSFDRSDMTNLNATEVTFQDCSLEGVDFSETRFVKARFLFSLPTNTRMCNFSNCKFEQVVFRNAVFEDCIFTGAVFISCYIEDQNTAKWSLLDASCSQDIFQDDTSNVSFV